MRSSLPRHAGLLVIALAITAPVAWTQEGTIDDPFARPEAAPPAPPPAGPGPLDALELTGVSTLGGQTMVGLTDRANNRTHWLSVGAEANGLLAAEFDPQRDAVRVVSGSASRWVAMRKAAIQPLALPRRTDGSIDWVHIRMSDKEKAREAEAMLTDILEVGQMARAARAKRAPPP